jgi:beta-mannosidase
MTRHPAVIRRELHAGWELSAGSGPVPDAVAGLTVPAAVPGCVHTDLLAAGLIADPFLDDNATGQQWIGLTDWTYATRIHVEASEPGAYHELVFEGLDTVATVLLDGQVLGEVANQFRTHRFDVTDRLAATNLDLEIRFRSPIRYANAESARLGARPRPFPMPFEAIRKSPASFGWDWGPGTFTSGIWRPVRLETWTVARLRTVRVAATPQGPGGVVEADVDVDRCDDTTDVTVTVALGGASTSVTLGAGQTSARLSLAVPDARRWWPIGHGEQPLYDVEVVLAAEGQQLDVARRRVGFRTVRWETAPDADGTPFTLVVNDRPIFVKGVNWIPDDLFLVRVDRARYEQRLIQAVEANVNLVRVWGGGIYESDDFYDLCDELGLLTWQDFAFACSAYPEEEPLRGEVVAEARDQITRLAHHASLVLLNGNNENLWEYEDKGWAPLLDGLTWGAAYYYEVLPALVAELAPHVPYTPGSPFSPGGQEANAEAHGSVHVWDVWNEKDWTRYRDRRPRFVAEFGWQGPPTWSTLTHALSDAPLTPESPGMIAHQKAVDGHAKLTRGLVPHFRVPADMETWHWAMQLNQALAVTAALEHYRAWAPRTMGAIVWQLNDCWPGTTWAAIDTLGRPKPLYYALERAFAPRHLSVQPTSDGLMVAVSNDTGAPWTGPLRSRRLDMQGEVLAEHYMDVALSPFETRRLTLDAGVCHTINAPSELLVVSLDDTRAVWFFTEPRDSTLPQAGVRLNEQAPGTIVVEAETVVRDLTFLVDKLHPDARIDAGLLTLLPGEKTTIHLTGAALDTEALADPSVMRSANELVQQPPFATKPRSCRARHTSIGALDQPQ